MKKRLLFGIYTIFLVAVFITDLFLDISGEKFILSDVFYWILLIGVLLAAAFYKLRSSFALRVGFFLFVFSAILTVFKVYQFAEILMRSSIIFWFVGIIQTLREYKIGR